MTINGHEHQQALLDSGNPYIGPDYPAALVTGQIMTPSGTRFVLTIRLASTTVTVLLSKSDAEGWARQILKGTSQMTDLIIPNGVLKQEGPHGV